MAEAETVIQFPQRTRLVCSSCGAKGEMGCGCGVEYVKPVVRAAAAVAASPEKSDRAIAEEIGVGNATVSRARRKSATVPSDTVETRTGRDGKRRRNPKPKPSVNRRIVVEPDDYQAFTTQAKAEGTTAQAKLGQMVADAVAGPKVEPETLSLSAREKLAAAERQMRRRLDAEHAIRMAALEEEVRQKVLTQNKEYVAMLNGMEREAREAKQTYRDFMGRQAKIFSKDEYRLIVMCVHADGSITVEKRNDATRLLIAKRFALTGEK